MELFTGNVARLAMAIIQNDDDFIFDAETNFSTVDVDEGWALAGDLERAKAERDAMTVYEVLVDHPTNELMSNVVLSTRSAVEAYAYAAEVGGRVIKCKLVEDD